MRMYFITNLYLSSIQNGIQPAHVVHEIFRKYRKAEESQACKELYDWADNHKTIMVINGGMTEHMLEARELIVHACQGNRTDGPKHAWTSFYEPGIGNALTCVGVVAPTWWYSDLTVPNSIPPEANAAELQLIEWMMARPLAR